MKNRQSIKQTKNQILLRKHSKLKGVAFYDGKAQHSMMSLTIKTRITCM